MIARAAPLVTGLVAGALVLAATSSLDAVEDESFRAQQRSMVVQRVATLRARLELDLNTYLAGLTAAEALVQTDPALDGATFTQFAELLWRQLPAIASIQLAPDGIISQVVPREGNEGSLGADILNLGDEHARRVARETRDGRQLRVAGPYALRQGGEGLVARKPIFVTAGGQERFWGFVTIVLDYQILLGQYPELNHADDLEFGLRGRDGLGERGEVFLGTAELFGPDAVTAPVILPGGSWQLAARPRGGWTLARPQGAMFRGLSWVLAAVVAALAAFAHSRTLRLRQAANRDPLTGALNRRAFARRAREEIDRARRHRRPLSLIMLDIDHFKELNDTRGHACGDAMLVAFAARVRSSLRSSDVFGRMGGEEFAVLAPETDLTQAAEFAERLRQDLRTMMVVFQGERVSRTVSAGVAQLDRGQTTLDDLMLSADGALYEAKGAGRDRVCRAEFLGFGDEEVTTGGSRLVRPVMGDETRPRRPQ